MAKRGHPFRCLWKGHLKIEPGLRKKEKKGTFTKTLLVRNKHLLNVYHEIESMLSSENRLYSIKL